MPELDSNQVPTPQQAYADAALALELIGAFFAQQIDAGAAVHGEVAALIRTSMHRVADRLPLQSQHIQQRGAGMIGRLPGEWASGDWQEPA